MADFSEITGRLLTGAAVNSSADVDALAAAGVTHVIDCRGEFDDAALLAAHPHMLYLWNGTADDGQPKSVDWFGKSLVFALPALAIPDTRIYAHCAAGVNRGPSMAYAIMRACGWDGLTALALIKAKRPVAQVRYSADADRAILSLGY